MSKSALARSLTCRLTLRSILTIALLVVPALAPANPVPDAMVYFNVRPAGPPEDYCVTEIARCADMNPSTDQQGLLEFQFFIDPQQGMHGAIPVPEFGVYLSWPEEWTLMDYRSCREMTSWNLDPSGPNPHFLEVEWTCAVPDGLFLALTLVFDVHGYGQLETAENRMLGLGCPAIVVTPSANHAEAGTGCEYSSQPCARGSYRCLPHLDGLQVSLTAPEGGTAHGELEFDIDGYPYPRCDFVANSDAPWVTGSVISDPGLYDAVLYVEADATGLPPGIHWAEVQISYDGFYNGAPVRTARCLPVSLKVEPASSVEDRSPSPSSTTAFGLQLAGANPSSGPFVFSYETPATSHVRCGVFDAAGRELLPLVDEEQPAGRQSVSWRGVDAAGRQVGPGVYLIRLACNEEMRSSRVVLVR